MGERYWIWLGARLLMGAVVIGWAVSYLTPGGGSSEKEFQKALNAMKQVYSVRAAYSATPTATNRTDVLWEVACAQDAYHFQQHFVETNPNGPAEFSREEMHVGSVEYDRKNGGWEQSKYGSGIAARAICANLDGTDGLFMPPIATMIHRGIIEKGEKKTVSGVRCREWNVAMKGAPSGLEHDTVCLGLDDHLPYEMTVDWKHSRTTYSDYNAPIRLDLPAPGLQSASATH